MIFVLLGTQPHHFTRLLNELEILSSEGLLPYIDDEIIIQAGFTPQTEREFGSFYQFMNTGEYDYYMRNADVIVTHGGAGSIFDALNLGKKIIVLPRLKQYNEHVDDHQVELVDELKEAGYIISEKTLAESFALLPSFTFKKYLKQKEQALKIINDYIEME